MNVQHSRHPVHCAHVRPRESVFVRVRPCLSVSVRACPLSPLSPPRPPLRSSKSAPKQQDSQSSNFQTCNFQISQLSLTFKLATFKFFNCHAVAPPSSPRFHRLHRINRSSRLRISKAKHWDHRPPACTAAVPASAGETSCEGGKRTACSALSVIFVAPRSRKGFPRARRQISRPQRVQLEGLLL